MRIYIASSWKNERMAINLAHMLRIDGHEVDCFCDASTGRYVFHWSEVGKAEDLDAISFLEDPRAQRAFHEDKAKIDWSDAVVLLLPSGKSSHLEAGYAVGSSKLLFVLGEFPKGEWEVMYSFADGLFRDLEKLRDRLLPGRPRQG